MDRLWAPWRIKYIRSKKEKKCIFCDAVKNSRQRYVVFKTKHSICLLNIYPYNNGHLMVSPIKHKRDLGLLSDPEASDLLKAVNKAKKLLDKVLRPQGYNIGINLSKVAGAGIIGHIHIHIVPRWRGDANFMPVVFNTKIISQSLDELHKLLRNAESDAD